MQKVSKRIMMQKASKRIMMLMSYDTLNKKEYMSSQCSSEGMVVMKSKLFFREGCQLINIEKIVD